MKNSRRATCSIKRENVSKYFSSLVLSFCFVDKTLVCDCLCVEKSYTLIIFSINYLYYLFYFRYKGLFFSVGKEHNPRVLSFTGNSPKIVIPVSNCES